jgi:hypothetical protein
MYSKYGAFTLYESSYTSTCGPVFTICLRLTLHTPSSISSQVILKLEVE